MLPKERDERPARGSLMKSNNELPSVLQVPGGAPARRPDRQAVGGFHL